jgi:hypothetical protein
MQRKQTVRGHLTDRTASGAHLRIAEAKKEKNTALDLLIQRMQSCYDVAFDEVKKFHQKTVNAGNCLIRLIKTAVKTFNATLSKKLGAIASYSERRGEIRFNLLY